jgi:hypothetical protein
VCCLEDCTCRDWGGDVMVVLCVLPGYLLSRLL